MEDDPLITISDMRLLFCVKGVRKVFDQAGGDFADFVKRGARASQLRGKGFDPSLDRVIAAKKAVQNGR